METTKNWLLVLILLAISCGFLTSPAMAQGGNTATTIKGKRDGAMIYHDGPVMQGHSNVYVILYGNWPTGPSETTQILVEFLANFGASPYSMINTTYPDSTGSRPSGVLFYGGAVYERSYSYGTELSGPDIQAIVEDQLKSGQFPIDVNGIYLVLSTPDVGSESTGFCTPLTPPHHGNVVVFGIQMKYAFVGNAARCPAAAASQFVASDGSMLPTPNGNLAGDAMVSTMAHALNTILTNPLRNAWFDRFGLENGDKCIGKFGQTYTTANGARANMRLGTRHLLIQQNWINTPIGYCALSLEELGHHEHGATISRKFGMIGDVPPPGDYGDGKTDAAFFRPATAEWLITNSSDGSFKHELDIAVPRK